MKSLTKTAVSRSLRIRLRQIIYRLRDSSPYISGDSIASCCDYLAYGKSQKRFIRAKRIARAHSIFVPGHKLVEFLNQYGSLITARVLVSGNSDENFTVVPMLPPSVKLLICQNLAVPNSNSLVTLPIGLENLRLGRVGLPKFHKRQNSFPIEDRILLPPMSPTNPIRSLVIPECEKLQNIFDTYTEYLEEESYFKLVQEYRFVMCLEGNGFENHRIWETLYRGGFPILLESDWSKTLKDLPIPILYIKEVKEINHQMLKSFLASNANFDPNLCEVLWMPYWRNLIRGDSPTSRTLAQS